MRVSNRMLSNNFISNLNSIMDKMMNQQAQISTNKRITKLSDDPIGTIQSMNARVELYRIDQYIRNVDYASTWLTQSETSVMELNEVIKSAYEVSIRASNTNVSASAKLAMAEQIGQLRDHILSIGNSKSGDKYIFGGFNTASPPFEVDTTGTLLYNGLDISNSSDPAIIAESQQITRYEVGFEMHSEISIPGTELINMGPDNIYAVLDGFYNALKAEAPAIELSQYVNKFMAAQSHTLNIIGKIGGVTNRLELVKNRHEEDWLNFTNLKSQIEDIDLAEAITNYKMTQSVYQAALQTAANIIQPTLADYLK